MKTVKMSKRSKAKVIRGRDKMSKVWDHFKLKIKDNIMVCAHCKMELAYHNSTSSMLQHLKRKHPFDDMSSRPETRLLQHKIHDVINVNVTNVALIKGTLLLLIMIMSGGK